MNDYEFTLKFCLPDPTQDPSIYVEMLGEAGCDDAVIGIGRKGRIALDFSRAAHSASQAITSAIEDVQRAIPGARLIEADPDMVGLADVAEILGFTRQNMRKLMLANPATFPLPVHDGTSALFHLASVLQWRQQHQQRPVDPMLLEVTTTNMCVNVVREFGRLPDAERGLHFDGLLAQPGARHLVK
jgi:hypothetical protein